MDSITVKKDELLAKMKTNRDNHRGVFEKAQEVYRAQIIKELDQMLDDAKQGRKIKRMVMLPEPEDHTSDYDRVIAMLEMSVDDEIDLAEHDFQQYVLDHWAWERSFASNTSSYLAMNDR